MKRGKPHLNLSRWERYNYVPVEPLGYGRLRESCEWLADLVADCRINRALCACNLTQFVAETVRLCVRGKNWRIYVSGPRLRTGLVSWPFHPFCSALISAAVCTDLKMVAAAVLAGISGKNGFQIHIFASLTHFIAKFWRFARSFSRIDGFSPPAKNWRIIESICVSGEFMRLKNQYWLIHSSSRNWRIYAPEVANN